MCETSVADPTARRFIEDPDILRRNPRSPGRPTTTTVATNNRDLRIRRISTSSSRRGRLCRRPGRREPAAPPEGRGRSRAATALEVNQFGVGSFGRPAPVDFDLDALMADTDSALSQQGIEVAAR